MNALIFDCDGVLADTERFGHLPAFNQMFAEFGLPVRWSEEEYGGKLKIGGGKERMMSLLTPEFVARAGLPTDADEQRALVARWHQRKTEIYTEMVTAGQLPARPGVRRAGRRGGSRRAGGLPSRRPPPSRRCGRCWSTPSGRSRPRDSSFSPATWSTTRSRLPTSTCWPWSAWGCRRPRRSSIEDSGNGLDAARAAGISCLVTVNDYTRDDDFGAAALVVSSLGDPDGEHTHVLADNSGAPVGDWVNLATLEALVS